MFLYDKMKTNISIPTLILWLSTILLIWTSIMDYSTYSLGINTYAMYFLIGIILIIVLYKSRSNNLILWNLPIISGVFFLTEIFNFIGFSFYPSTSFFLIYTVIFSIVLIASLILIKKESIPFDFKKCKSMLVISLTLFAVLTGYLIQWTT